MVLLWYCFDIWGWFGAGLGHVIFYICRRFGECWQRDMSRDHVKLATLWQRNPTVNLTHIKILTNNSSISKPSKKDQIIGFNISIKHAQLVTCWLRDGSRAGNVTIKW